MKNPYEKYIGKSVKYYDFLDTERFGRIVALEQSYMSDTPYVYIADEEEEFNVHIDTINGVQIKYAELRLSTEVYILKK